MYVVYTEDKKNLPVKTYINLTSPYWVGYHKLLCKSYLGASLGLAGTPMDLYGLLFKREVEYLLLSPHYISTGEKQKQMGTKTL